MAQSDLTRVVEPACRKLAEEQQVELVDVALFRRFDIHETVSP